MRKKKAGARRLSRARSYPKTGIRRIYGKQCARITNLQLAFFGYFLPGDK